jgi:hypothetical protein
LRWEVRGFWVGEFAVREFAIGGFAMREFVQADCSTMQAPCFAGHPLALPR